MKNCLTPGGLKRYLLLALALIFLAVAPVFGQQQHITWYGYADSAQTSIIWDAWYDQPSNTWHVQQINGSVGKTKGPRAVTGSLSVSAFGKQLHFAYADTSGTIWDSFYDGSANKWNLQTINGAIGKTAGPPVGFGAGPYVSTFTTQQHFTYGDATGNLWDAFFDRYTVRWNLQQIAGNGGITAGPLMQIQTAPIVSVLNKQQHFAYLDRSGNLWDPFWDNAAFRWNLQQLTGPGSKTNGPAGGYLSSVSVFKNQQHFVYLDVNVGQTVYDAFWDSTTNRWNFQQINSPSGGPAGVTSGPAVFLVPPFVAAFNNQQHFCYGDFSGTLWDSWWNDGNFTWNLQQINSPRGGSAGVTKGPAARLAVFLSAFGKQLHYAYDDQNGLIWDSFYDSTTNRWNLQQINGSNIFPGGKTTGGLGVNPFVTVFTP